MKATITNIVGLRGKVEELNRRAERHGMNKLTLNIEKTVELIRWPSLIQETLYSVELEGATPVLEGWELLGKVEFSPVGTIVRTLGADLSEYRECAPICEHCNTTRRRKDVFILEREGERRVVGRNCLADFLRTDAAEKLLDWADTVATDIWGESEGSWGEWGMDLQKYLTSVATCVRRLGWIPKSSEEGTPTVYAVSHLLRGIGQGRLRWIRENELYTSPEDQDLAAKALEWAKNQRNSSSEYLHTLGTIAASGAVCESVTGYAASMIVAYKKAVEKELSLGAAAELQWFGEVGVRARDVEVTCLGTHTIDGMYGLTTIVRFETDGARLVWFASGEKNFEAGEKYVIDATVKEHNEHEKYGKQTKVNRVRVK